ncbi:26114_t:CDS:2, partial [Gigaspora margarita]
NAIEARQTNSSWYRSLASTEWLDGFQTNDQIYGTGKTPKGNLCRARINESGNKSDDLEIIDLCDKENTNDKDNDEDDDKDDDENDNEDNTENDMI